MPLLRCTRTKVSRMEGEERNEGMSDDLKRSRCAECGAEIDPNEISLCERCADEAFDFDPGECE